MAADQRCNLTKRKKGKKPRVTAIVRSFQKPLNITKHLKPSLSEVQIAYQSLLKYVPPGAFVPFCEILQIYPIYIKISRPRKTKLGDYRRSFKGDPPRISVNANLNPFAFTLTLLHELAHHISFELYGASIQPHGKEWRKTFKQLFEHYFLEKNIFPNKVQVALEKYFNYTFASSCSDPNLMQVLNEFDCTQPVYLKDIPENSLFHDGKRTFRKLNRIRKNFRILEVKTGREFRANPMLSITPI